MNNSLYFTPVTRRAFDDFIDVVWEMPEGHALFDKDVERYLKRINAFGEVCLREMGLPALELDRKSPKKKETQPRNGD